MFGIDCHTHSGNSPDGTGTVGGLCRRAISLGLEALAITEHVELNRWHSQGYYGTTPRNDEEEYSYYKRMEKAMKDNHAAKEAYGNRLHIISGIELGQIPCDFGLADSVMQDNRLDFVIASLHELKNKPDFYFLDYSKTAGTIFLGTADTLSVGKIRCAGTYDLSAALHRRRSWHSGRLICL